MTKERAKKEQRYNFSKKRRRVEKDLTSSLVQHEKKKSLHENQVGLRRSDNQNKNKKSDFQFHIKSITEKVSR